MTRKYYTLIGFDLIYKKYVALFGAWDREDVEAEKDEYAENTDYRTLRIICTAPDQVAIDAAIAKRNK